MVKQPTDLDLLERTAVRLAAELLELEGEARRRRLVTETDAQPALRRRVEQLLARAETSVELRLEAIPSGLLEEVFGPGPSPRGAVLEPGRCLGGLRVLRCLGHGGMGSVYEAEQERPRRNVALKVLRGLLPTEAEQHRFEAEIAALARLNHPNIGGIFAAGRERESTPLGDVDLPYFVMELVRDARSLTRYAEEERLSPEERVALVRDVARAVHHAHAAGVVHRDLKPENVLVGRDGVPKVIDFGIARFLDPEGAATGAATQPGALLATLRYASPEQVEADAEAIGPATDVYALGVLLYQLLTGAHPTPVDGDSLRAWTRAIVETPPVRPRTLCPSLDPDLEVILLTALEKEPELRYPSAAAFAEDLERALAHRPIVAQPPTSARRVRLFVRRNPALCGAAGILVVAGLAFGLVTHALGRRAEEAESQVGAREEDLQRVSRDLLFGVHDAIDALPGAIAAREQVVRTALDTLDGLASRAVDDPGLRRDVAEGYARLAHVLGFPTDPSRGDLEGALDAYRKALGLLATLPPNSVEAGGTPSRARRSELLREEGVVLRALGRHGEALTAQREALDLARELYAERAAEDSGAAWRLVSALAQGGDLALELGEREEAKGLFDEALALAQEAELPRDEHVLHNKLGDLASAAGDRAAASMHYARALELARTLAEGAPGDVHISRDLGVTFARAGRDALERGDLDEAADCGARALDEAQARVDADPLDRIARGDLAVAHSVLAAVRQARRDAAGAAEGFAAAVELLDGLCREVPDNRDFALHRGVLLVSLAECQRDQGELDLALETAREALAQLTETAARTEEVSEPTRRRLIAMDLVGSLLLARGDLEEALRATSAYHEAARLAVESAAHDLGLLRQRMVAEDRMGMVHQALGARLDLPPEERVAHYEAAMEWYERTLGTFDEYGTIAAPQPGDAQAMEEIEAELLRCDDALAALE